MTALAWTAIFVTVFIVALVAAVIMCRGIRIANDREINRIRGRWDD